MANPDAINQIKIACTQWSLGYDWSARHRLDFYDGGETDCSALVIFCCEQSGLLPGNDIRNNVGATYTGNMLDNFQARGWLKLDNLPVSQLQPGDVLLRVEHHTAMYVGNGQIAMASHDEHGGTGVEPGNRTGQETLVCPYYNSPHWDCVLRFNGVAQPPAAPCTLTVDGVIGDASAKKLQAILGLPLTGVIARSTFTALQIYVGAPHLDGIASNQNSAAVAAHWPALKSFTVGVGGSPFVKSLQARIGVEQDGELGPDTACAFQTRLNTGQL
jgi:hypothetical protein